MGFAPPVTGWRTAGIAILVSLFGGLTTAGANCPEGTLETSTADGDVICEPAPTSPPPTPTYGMSTPAERAAQSIEPDYGHRGEVAAHDYDGGEPGSDAAAADPAIVYSAPLPARAPASLPAPAVRPLTPARRYLRAAQIPPPGLGAYGVVSFPAKATSASRARMMRICEAFKAYLPRQQDMPASIPASDHMLTIWPLDAPEAALAQADDCAFVVDHYDLYGGQSAIADARRQNGAMNGEGPFLIGWSPSSDRGVPDKLVLIVSLSGLSSQESVNSAFHFWQSKIIEDPSLWRNGFSRERLRLSIKDFVDRYGEALVGAVKLVGRSGSP